jgi:hypothetical protein
LRESSAVESSMREIGGCPRFFEWARLAGSFL